MQAAKKNILITGSLSDAQAAPLLAHHSVDIIPFISIEPLYHEDLKKQINALAEQHLKVVFTSNNAVKAVSAMLSQKPSAWKLYSMQGVTSLAVQNYFGADSLAATALSSEQLAEEILKDSTVSEVLFFCGDLRRDELPLRLSIEGVQVRELIVYNTVASPVKLEKQYDAVAFFSPSAVYSFAAQNAMPAYAVCFAIGNTTANTIKNIVPNEVRIAQPPQKERVVEMMLEYYKQEEK